MQSDEVDEGIGVKDLIGEFTVLVMDENMGHRGHHLCAVFTTF